MELPQDPFMLMSFVNMKLRNHYDSLDEFCAANDIDREALCQRLKSIGMEYSAENNKFW